MISLNELLFPDQLENDLATNINGELQINWLIKKQERKNIEELEQKISTDKYTNKNRIEPLRMTWSEKKQKNEEKLKSLQKWGGISKKELDEQDQMDLKILEQRKTLDHKTSYKNAQKINHSYVQFGTVIGSRTEGNQGLLRKKEKGQRIIDQFKLQDKSIDKSKTQFYEIQDKKMSMSKNKKWQKLKRIKLENNQLVAQQNKLQLDQQQN